MKKWTAATLAGLLALALSTAPAQAAPPTESPAKTSAADSQTMLVTFDQATPNAAAVAEAAVQQASDTVSDVEVTGSRQVTETTVEVTLTGGLSASETQKVVSTVEQRPGIEGANEAAIFHASSTENVNAESTQWNINTDYRSASSRRNGVAAKRAWDTYHKTGSGVVVGVVDTGITPHPDLTGSDASIIGGNVIPGYDFVDWDDNPTDDGDWPGQEDYRSSWHGTHVAGIIAALRNGTGVVGVAPDAQIEPLRVLGPDGGSEADIIAAITWAVGGTVGALAPNPNPVQVLNLSLGTSRASNGNWARCSAGMQQAVNLAVSKGVPVVVAAGNEATWLQYSSPANCQNVIRVTATQPSGAYSNYSNYGTRSFPATIAAPGGRGCSTTGTFNYDCPDDVFSTINMGPQDATIPGYTAMAGTSMAAPHVAAVLALLRQAHPTWSVAQMVQAIRGSAVPVKGCASLDCGAGIVNAYNALGVTSFFTKKKPASVSGTYRVGRTLKAKNGVWGPRPSRYSYQWLRNDLPIAKATKSSYKLTKRDKGKYISVQVTIIGRPGRAAAISVTGNHRVK